MPSTPLISLFSHLRAASGELSSPYNFPHTNITQIFSSFKKSRSLRNTKDSSFGLFKAFENKEQWSEKSAET